VNTLTAFKQAYKTC